MKKVVTLLLFGFFIFAAGATGCKKQDIKKGSESGGSAVGALDFADEPSLRGEYDKDINLKTVYFDFDRSELTQDALFILKENAAYVINNPEINIVVEGHCDERGTIEYNLSLGQRRAVKVKEYYTQLGVPANRIATISYGEEKPADSRNNESAWSKNRRAETKAMVK